MTSGKKENVLLDRMFAVGAHFGYSRSRRHPSTTPYIFGAKNKAEIIDLEKTSALLEEAKDFVRNLGKEGKVILFVGGKSEAREAVNAAADALSMPKVTGRWIGGTLTNFSEIKKRIARFEDLVSQRGKGELASKYTKHEQLMFDREIERLNTSFSGLLPMKEMPKAMVIVDTKQESIAVDEARVMKIPIVGIMNSDCDLKGADYPVVGNDSSRASITFFVNELVEAYKEGTQKKD